MLQAHRLLNLKYCVIYTTSLVLQCLLERGATSLEDLFRYCHSISSDIEPQDITLAVSFLYILKKATYCGKQDVVTLVEAAKC